MFTYLTILMATLVVACAGDEERQEAIVAKNDTVEDYIKVAELKETDLIRTRSGFDHKVITERYVIVHDRRRSYLVTFNRRCRELNQTIITPDVRHETSTIRARFDTLRGCKIHSIYEVSEGQADELITLGDETPGK